MFLSKAKNNLFLLSSAFLWTFISIFSVPIPLRTESWFQFFKGIVIIVLFFIFFVVAIRHAMKARYEFKDNIAKIHGDYWLVFWSALLCAAVWSVYGIIFYPGLISWDFYVQWHEMSGKIPLTDWHPFFHTLLIWMVTRIWYSPAMVVIVQILFMSAIVGFSVRVLQNAEVSKRVIIITVLFYAFFPLNGFYAISLWKDIFYAISFFMLSLLIIDIIISGGRKIKNISTIFLIFIALFLVSTTRHNGIVVSFGCIFLLIVFFYKKFFLSLLLLLIILLSSLLSLKGPVASYLKVDFKTKNVLKSQIMIQHIGAVLNDKNSIVKEKEKEFLSKIIPLFLWKNKYYPLSCMALAFGKDKGVPILNGKFLEKEDNYKKFLSLWKDIVVRNPIAIARYYIKSTELVWKISSQYSLFVIPNDGLTENDLYHGYKPSLEEKAVGLKKILLKTINNHSSGFFLHRGAIYFWLIIFSLFIVFVKSRNKLVFLAASPFLLQAVTIAAFPLVQDTRFMFPIILTAPALIALFFSSALNKNDAKEKM